MVFPRFFTTYVPKVARLLSSYRSRRSSELLLDTPPPKASPSWSTTPNAKQSTSWPNQHSAKSLPKNSVELNNQTYNASGLTPYTGNSIPPTTNISGYIGNHELQPYKFSGPENEVEQGQRIWKTVHVSRAHVMFREIFFLAETASEKRKMGSHFLAQVI